jgi:hypothetical protein
MSYYNNGNNFEYRSLDNAGIIRELELNVGDPIMSIPAEGRNTIKTISVYNVQSQEMQGRSDEEINKKITIRIKHIWESLGYYCKLTTLKFVNIKVDKLIPPNLNEIGTYNIKLTTLKIQNCTINKMGSLSILPKLTDLKFNSSVIEKLDDVYLCKTITSLDFINNSTIGSDTKMITGIKEMIALDTLIINSMLITELPDDLFALPQLKRLTLGLPKLTQLPSITQHIALEYIEIWDSINFKITDDFYNNATQLTELLFQECSNLKILPGISKLQKLDVLHIENCGNFVLPHEIYELSNLTALCLSNSNIKLPNTTDFVLPNLKYLKLTGIELEFIPDWIIQSSSIVRLIITDNPKLENVKNITKLVCNPNIEIVTDNKYKLLYGGLKVNKSLNISVASYLSIMWNVLLTNETICPDTYIGYPVEDIVYIHIYTNNHKIYPYTHSLLVADLHKYFNQYITGKYEITIIDKINSAQRYQPIDVGGVTRSMFTQLGHEWTYNSRKPKISPKPNISLRNLPRNPPPITPRRSPSSGGGPPLASKPYTYGDILVYDENTNDYHVNWNFIDEKSNKLVALMLFRLLTINNNASLGYTLSIYDMYLISLSFIASHNLYIPNILYLKFKKIPKESPHQHDLIDENMRQILNLYIIYLQIDKINHLCSEDACTANYMLNSFTEDKKFTNIINSLQEEFASSTTQYELVYGIQEILMDTELIKYNIITLNQDGYYQLNTKCSDFINNIGTVVNIFVNALNQNTFLSLFEIKKRMKINLDFTKLLPEIIHTAGTEPIKQSPQIDLFNKYIKEVITPDQQKGRKLLTFWTGSSSISMDQYGVAWTSLDEDKEEKNHKLPSAHTCNNTLDIPMYTNYDIFKSKFDTALGMTAADDFGFAGGGNNNNNPKRSRIKKRLMRHKSKKHKYRRNKYKRK